MQTKTASKRDALQDLHGVRLYKVDVYCRAETTDVGKSTYLQCESGGNGNKKN